MFWTIILGQAAVCALLSGVVAGSKNRNVVLWGIAGFLFGFLGLLAAVGVPAIRLGGWPTSIGPAMVKLPTASATPVERNLESDAYRLWLADRYAIQRNDVFSAFVVGDKMFPDLEQALVHADLLEQEKVSQAAKAAAEAERQEQMRLQRAEQALEEEEERKRKFWRQEIWIIGGVVAATLGGVGFYVNMIIGKMEADETAKRAEALAVLEPYGIPILAGANNVKIDRDSYGSCSAIEMPTLITFRIGAEEQDVMQFYFDFARTNEFKQEIGSDFLRYNHKDGRQFTFTITALNGANTEVGLCIGGKRDALATKARNDT